MSDDTKPPPADSCWQCNEPLGTGPERCLTCAAKRAEDRAAEFAGGHLPLCESRMGGDSPWCSCGYDAWREESDHAPGVG